MGCLNLTSSELKKLCKGRTPEQQTAIRYFVKGGCLDKKVSDEEYESLVMAKVKSIDFKQKALDKIGLDESQVNEVPPVHFEDYYFATTDDKTKTRECLGKDDLWRSSAYQITWLFFSSTQVYMYQYTINMDEDGKKERTEEYFYKDITNFSTTSESEERIITKTNCLGKTQEKRLNVDTTRFTLIVPGDKFYAAMKQNDYTEKAVQGMKAKLREKKG